MNKKGFDGMYIIIGLLFGFLGGAGLIVWATLNGYLSSFLCPVV